MKKFLDSLKGYKTYILASIGGIIFILARLGYINGELEAQIYTVLGIGSVATLRSGIKNKK